MDLDKSDDELRIEHEQEKRMELIQESREEPFYNWVESLNADELIELTYCDKKTFIAEHKDTLMKEYCDGV
jgi:hypothetical protein